MEPIKLLVILVLAATVVSLGVALFQLAKGGDGSSSKLLRSLTVRIVLSVALFVLLMIAWRLGLIKPHGVAN